MPGRAPLSVFILNNVPTPYFEPLFQQIGDRSGWRLTVCYASAWNCNVGWEESAIAGRGVYRTVVLDRGRPGSALAAAISLARLLLEERPDYLLCYGYTLAPQITALLFAVMTAMRFALIGDANYFNDQAAGLRRWAKSAWLRLLVRRAAAVIAIGTASQMFWESYGARPSQLFEARFAVENDFFERECERRRGEAAAWREKHQLDEKIVFLYVGRLVKRKNVDLILRAFRLLNDDRAALVIVGSGRERRKLEALAGDDRRVFFAGSAQPNDLPLYYAVADALVLVAGQEPWGLVINEAMASGLAIIAHRHCGAAIDLVSEENGVVIEDLEVEALLAPMRSIVNDSTTLLSMKRHSKEKIKNWSIGGAACGIIRAIEESSGPRCFVVDDLKPQE